ncbi:MAG TPA: PHP domain-containing protein [Clostridia bacterium]|jgi:putative hydrolase|nr:PHP domain-containing protein [Clostridia bacterium]
MNKDNNMKFYGDYHTHTKYSDGHITVRQNIQAAFDADLKDISITDHGYNSPDFGSLTPEKMRKQRAEIEKIKPEFPTLNIHRGVEANIVGSDGTIDLTEKDYEDFDYIIAGFHAPTRPKNIKSFRELYLNSYFYFLGTSKAARERNTKTYIEMVKKYPIAIIAHINHLTKVNVKEVAKCCADYGTYIELNAKYIHDLSYNAFEEILATEAILIANSDGHYTEHVGNFSRIIKYLKNYPGIENRIVNTRPGTVKFRTHLS